MSLTLNNEYKLPLIVAIILFLVVAWFYLSGFIFLSFADQPTSSLTFTTILDYSSAYFGKNVRATLLLIFAMFVSTTIVTFPIIALFLKKKESLYGDAKWATNKDIKKAGLFSEAGIIVGVKKSFLGLFSKYLVLGGSLHALLEAPTRSGKGVGVVIPNLLTWPDSVVVVDVKSENWDITSGFRSAYGQECYMMNFAPRDYKTHCWNPLFYISDDPNFRINDIQKIGNMLFPNIKAEAPIWQASARSLWLGLVLYLIETEELTVSLGEVFRQILQGDERLNDIVDSRQISDKPLSNQCYLALKEYLDTPEKTRGSIKKSFTASLELFYNPVIDAATSSNDFDLNDLRKKRMSIYIGVTPDDLERLQPLLNLFFQQLIDINTRELPEKNPDLKYQALLLPDEFAALGNVSILNKSIAYIAGYGLRMLPILQSRSQLRSIYGNDDAETFTQNHALNIIFPPKDPKEAREISERIGNKTIINTSKSKPIGLGKGSRSKTQSDHSRALILPQEVINLGKEKELILLENCPPIKCHKIVWYKDKIFSERGNNLKEKTPLIRYKSPGIPTLEIKEYNVEFKQSDNKKETLRPVASNDLDNINLDNFNCDFSNVEVPTGEINDADMEKIVDGFFNSFKAA